MGFATGRHMCQACIRYPFDVEDVVRMVRAVYAERVVFHDGDAELDEGLTLHKVGGHSAGLQMVRVETARGPIVDEAALTRALVERRIAGAGLDVFEEEPTPRDNPLLTLDTVIVTPHAICFTDECMRRLAESAFRAAVSVAHGRVPPYVVDPAALRHPRLAGLAPA